VKQICERGKEIRNGTWGTRKNNMPENFKLSLCFRWQGWVVWWHDIDMAMISLE
jgi:hypothetical protein